MEDDDIPFFINFIYDFLARYKQYFDKKNAERAKEAGKVIPKIKEIPEKVLSDIKVKIDFTLDMYITKRIPEVKNKFRAEYIKMVQSEYNEKEIKRSFTNLLNTTKYINENIVAHIVDNSLNHKQDMEITLRSLKITEAEQGFSQQLNAFSYGEKIFDFVRSYYKKLFGGKWKDIKFKIKEVVKGYFSKLYNKNVKIKDPKISDLRLFRDDLLKMIDRVLNYIEKVLVTEINNTKRGFTIYNINTFLTVDLKDQGIKPDDINNDDNTNTGPMKDDTVYEPDVEEVGSEDNETSSEFSDVYNLGSYNQNDGDQSNNRPNNNTQDNKPNEPESDSTQDKTSTDSESGNDTKEEPTEIKEQQVIYLSIPNEDGSFNAKSARTSYQDGSSLYKLTKTSDTKGTFQIYVRDSSLRMALQYPEKCINIVCEPQNAYNPNSKSITVTELGEAELNGDKWVVTKKCKMRYE